MDELKRIAKEMEDHPLQHRLISESIMFDTRKRYDSTIPKIKARIIAHEKAIKKIKDNMRHTTKTGHDKAIFITRMRGAIKYKITLIKTELESLCNI